MTDLPKSKYSDPIHTPGKEFQLNGKEYVGWYIVTYLDRYYAGKTLTRDSKEIFRIKETPVQSRSIFTAQQVSPSTSERISGIWRRYIIQKINSQAIIEATKDRYDSFEGLPGHKRQIIDWVIKGPAQDITKGPYVYKGAENKNRETISKLETTIPGITNFFKDYSEFVE